MKRTGLKFKKKLKNITRLNGYLKNWEAGKKICRGYYLEIK